MLVLGLETSCDETSAALVRDGVQVLSNVIASQAALHARYGGVVPEAASRMHVERMLYVLQDALQQADCTLPDVDAIAVTNRPGLLGALLVGVSAAKALAQTLHKPLVGVHHLEGHIYSAFLAEPQLQTRFPLLALVVSGGHTMLLRMEGHGEYALLGTTRDDAAGEAFDKGARLMGLPYPGGPQIARIAAAETPNSRLFPRSWMGDTLDFSFSGVKTALRQYIQRSGGGIPLPLLAAEYQEAIVDMLVNTTERALQRTGIQTLCLVGGVAANQRLQQKMQNMASARGVHTVTPQTLLCTDNAAMIAAAGTFTLQRKGSDPLSMDTFAAQNLVTKPANNTYRSERASI